MEKDGEQNDMINWTQVREGINQVSTQLATGTVTSADILKNVMPYILAVADLGIKMENDHANLGAQMVTKVGSKAEGIITPGSYRCTHQQASEEPHWKYPRYSGN